MVGWSASRLQLVQIGGTEATPAYAVDNIDPMDLRIACAAIGYGLAGVDGFGKLVILPLENGTLQSPRLSLRGVKKPSIAWIPKGDVWLAVLDQDFDGLSCEYILALEVVDGRTGVSVSKMQIAKGVVSFNSLRLSWSSSGNALALYACSGTDHWLKVICEFSGYMPT